MTTETGQTEAPRVPLTRDRVLRAAIELADREGFDALSMRRLGQELGVEAMSLYNHVDNKEDLVDGMVEMVVDEIELPPVEGPWKRALRRRILSARRTLVRHPWAPPVIETRTTMSRAVLAYYDGLLGILRRGGLSLDLAHHAMHALGSRALGFTQELFQTKDGDDPGAEVSALMLRQMAAEYPYVTELATEVSHDDDETKLGVCDDRFEFEFGLDLILDGLEQAWQRDQG